MNRFLLILEIFWKNHEKNHLLSIFTDVFTIVMYYIEYDSLNVDVNHKAILMINSIYIHRYKRSC